MLVFRYGDPNVLEFPVETANINIPGLHEVNLECLVINVLDLRHDHVLAALFDP